MKHEDLISQVVAERNFLTAFTSEEEQEAKRAAALQFAANGRADLRERPLVTIDDETAKDFDDAVGCEALPDGGFLLTVAIADVSAFVEENSALDLAAKARGNSVYLPDRVLPMLPFALSAAACSLAEGQERACLVCEMKIRNGEISQYRFYRALIRSAARLSYTQAAAQMAGENCRFELLPLLAKLCEEFRQKRMARGGMLLELPEKTCVVANGKLQTEDKARNIAHWAIEEAMIAANRCAADFILRRNAPALHRAHPPPPQANIDKMRAILTPLKIAFPARPQAADFAKTLEQAQKQNPALAAALIPAVLGAMARAEYVPDGGIGHFGLACAKYLHFTSPIRRYPDLLTHRAIVAALAAAPAANGGANEEALAELAQTGAHCTATEVAADKAGWDCRQRLLCVSAQRFVGCEYEGIVSGVRNNGIFLTAAELSVDGFVRVSDMPGYWRYDEENQRLSCADKTLYLGCPARARLKAVDPARGRVDFTLLT